jgi:NAD(P)-dependent dehydrogenase (short-subunit alcohol dehydrogenase family)
MSPEYFKDKKVVIIGASSGIGEDVAKKLSHAGAATLIFSRRIDDLKKISGGMKNSIPAFGDISTFEGCKNICKNIHQHFQYIDHLVISAGVFTCLPFDLITEEELNTALNTNLKGPFFIIQHCLPMLKEGSGRSIVVISSELAHLGAVNTSAYAASKGGLSALVRSLAIEFTKYNIRINSLSPGHIDTQMISNLTSSQTKRKSLESQYPCGRIGCVNDISYFTLFLLSNESSWITGMDYLIDGGRSIWG